MARHHLLTTVAAILLATASAPALSSPNASAQPELVPEVGLELVADGFDAPLFVLDAPDGTDRLFVLEQAGTVRVVDQGQRVPGAWLDVSDRTDTTSERGLLGLAFHPDFAENGEVYVSYTGPGGDTRLVRHVLEDPVQDEPGTELGELLLEVDQPYANHNGGHLAFGPDGYLHWSLGDGGAAGDPHLNGQDPTTLLGSLLRLDVSPEEGYAIPEDNPFADGEQGAPEIWAYGLRNPWRFSFDSQTGDLWIGDVGQNTMEEVDREPADSEGGHNYGWNVFEGHLPYELGVPHSVPTFPVIEYPHDAQRCSVTGGYVYHGEAIDSLEGAYVFGDFCSGEVLAGLGEADARAVAPLLQTNAFVSSFGQDADGELYVVDHLGRVSKLVPA